MDISTRALLVNTTVRVWTGEKRDRGITREICTLKGAENNAVRANKSLLGERIRGVQSAERALRQAVHDRTLPWMDDGTRILKGAAFMAFTEMLAGPDAKLSTRHRELLILRVAWRTHSGYEWAQHSRMGADAGLTAP